MLASGACDVYDASLLSRARDAGRDARADTGIDGALDPDGETPPVPPPPVPPPPDPDMGMPDPDAGSGCMPRRPPERPVLADGPSMPVRWYALRDLRFGVGVAWREIGYDLDGRCTTSMSTGDEVECAPPPGFTPADDAPNGLDNTFGQTFIPLLTLVEPDYEGTINRHVERGEYGILIRLAEWNGTQNDPVVDFAIVDSIRGFAQASDPEGPDPIEPPAWDGTDEWYASRRSFVSGDFSRPLARDTAAYIVDGLLVARPRDGTEVNITGHITLTLKVTGATVTARLTDGNRALEGGILAGRWALDDVFNTLPRLDVCPDSDTYTAISEALRRSADVTTDGDATPFLLCEAISLGIGFGGVTTSVAQVVEARPLLDYCDDVDEMLCLETCPTSNDGICDDGGTGSRRLSCDLGTDCSDCGWRPG
ncbi:MAG: hypothetical protein IT379_12065 [Deltaproteobacteria bacterium]|nr:hypothetical protein [Deltaproteobacteria bacterium]